MATSTSPSRQGRPNVSVIMTAPHPRLARSRRAEASGSIGNTVAEIVTLDVGLIDSRLLAHTKP